MNKRKLACLGAVLLSAWLASASTGRAALTRQGRWLVHNGRHFHGVGVDQQQLAAQDGVDYRAALDEIASAGFRKVRIWVHASFLSPEAGAQPYAYQDGRYDLDTWNEDYWHRLRDFVGHAGSRGVLVEVTIFNFYHDWWEWEAMFWNKDRNSNGVFSGQGDGGDLWPEFFLPDYEENGVRVRDHQRRLIDKTCQELAGFDNVYFETFNEFAGDGSLFSGADAYHQWQRDTADAIKAHGRLVVVDVPIDSWGGWSYYWDHSSVDVLGSHTYMGMKVGDSPDDIARAWSSAQTRDRVLQCNESHGIYSGLDMGFLTRELWGHVASGVYFGLYLDQPWMIGSPEWHDYSEKVQVINGIFDSMEWWRMSPVNEWGGEIDGVVSAAPGAGWQVLAEAGRSYLVYTWGDSGSDRTVIELPAGTYEWDYIDVRNGTIHGSGVVEGSGQVSIPAPAHGSWDGSYGLVLLLRRSGEGGSAPPVEWPAPGAGEAPSEPAPSFPTVPSAGTDPSPLPGPHVLSGLIEAENHRSGGNGVGNSDWTAENEGGVYRAGSADIEWSGDEGGGFNVAYTDPGEWLAYRVSVPQGGVYDLDFRVASPVDDRRISVEFHSGEGVVAAGSVGFSATGAWQAYETHTLSGMNLPAGDYVMRVVFDTGHTNLNWIVGHAR